MTIKNNYVKKSLILVLIYLLGAVTLYSDTAITDIYEEIMQSSGEISDYYATLKADLAIIEKLLVEIDKKYAVGEISESDIVLIYRILDELEKRVKRY